MAAARVGWSCPCHEAAKADAGGSGVLRLARRDKHPVVRMLLVDVSLMMHLFGCIVPVPRCFDKNDVEQGAFEGHVLQARAPSLRSARGADAQGASQGKREKGARGMPRL